MAERDESHADIDWAAAEVVDGGLTVPWAGKPSKAWADHLDEIIGRLWRSGHGWESVKVTRKRLKVASVHAGAESDLRHFLEGAVLQCNADFEADRPSDADASSPADDAMTATFRGFADGA
jgi:hypothetical protein